MLQSFYQKRLLLVSLAILSIILLISCQKSKDHNNSRKENKTNETENPIFTETEDLDRFYGSEKIEAYNAMSDSAKYLYWKNRLKEYIDSNYFNCDNTQLTALTELIDTLSFEVYTDSSTRAAFVLNYLEDWLTDNEALLDDHQVRFGDLLSDPESSIDDQPQGKYAPFDIGGGEIEGTPKCICSLGSSYTCRKVSVGFPSGVTVTYGVCESSAQHNTCNTSNYGCGFLGLWSCNGNHCQF
ncbi:MAG: bacteriocin fulvocin C-related protein [Chitinophagaceae bacterium]|nr:bacteriocin fulvocin C-related protein [Chitinophagaceae bacterium]MBK9380955.1 bacteriocin fulvocin C-related protein [Chitinophagaceae bacterium]MBL0306720.1 bacteriocin fulvocin C-related protein [Chitinophagaceae bacterium]MBP9195464.1 bacteriocin fulvocin C-related protein [Saprospiraceae bacterium]